MNMQPIERGGVPSAAMPQVKSSPFGGFILWVFVISLFIPIQIFVGELRLSPYRIILLLLIVPAFFKVLASAQTRIRLADLLLAVYALVGAMSLSVTGSSVPTLGIFIVDALGPYLLARAYITNLDRMITFARILAFCIIATIPFAVYEALTARPIILDALDPIFEVLPDVPHETRLGLDRAQVVFDHPILYGIFCSLGFSLALLVSGLRRSMRWSIIKGGLVGVAVFLSLSSGAYMAVALQCALIGYDKVFGFLRRRWLLFIVGLTSMLVFLELASNRTLAQLALNFVALNPGTAWTHLAVNDAAMHELSSHMWFGLGMVPEWDPPDWLVTTSIDNFYIATAFRHGVPTIVLLLLAILAMVLAVARAKLVDPRMIVCRTALLITIAAVMVAVITVHMWNTTYVGFIFLIGAGMWLAEAREPPRPSF